MNADLCAKKRMGTSNKRRPVVPEPLRGYFFLPADGAEIRLNPTEASLFRLFLAHPEGISAGNLSLYWEELRQIYGQESLYDDIGLQENALKSLCAGPKTIFYSNISRIKKKFTDALGPKRAALFFIHRSPDGLYRTEACIPER